MSLWKNPKFTRFFIASTTGSLGDWFDIFALQIIFAHEWHASPIILGTLVLFYFLPSIVLGPIAGVWVDRISKRNLMLVTDLVAAGLTLELFLSRSIYEALLLVLIRGAVVSFNMPAQQAYIKHVVADGELLKASSYTIISFQVCKVIGPMLGALVLLYASARTCLAINALSFLFSAAILATLTKDHPKNNGVEDRLHWIKDTTTGLKFISSNYLLRTTVIIVMFWFYCSLLRQAQLVIFLQCVVPNQKEALGIFMGLDGLGAVTTSMLLSRTKEIVNYANYFLSGFLLLGLGIFGVGIYHTSWSYLILYACAPIIGLGTGVLLVVYGYLIKKETPSNQIGRVSGTSSALQNAALAAGTFSSGFFVLQFGVRAVYLALSVIMLALAFGSFIFIRKHHS